MPKVVDHKLRRDDLARAAFTVIGKRGIAAATLREVAREAGCSSALLVHYIKTKEQLLLEAHEFGNVIVRGRMAKVEKRWKGVEAFRRVLWESLPLDKGRVASFRVWLGFWEMAGQSVPVQAALTRGYKESQSRLARMIREAQALGELPHHLDVELLAWGATTLHDGIGVQVLVSGKSISAHRQRQYVDHWIEQMLQPRRAKRT